MKYVNKRINNTKVKETKEKSYISAPSNVTITNYIYKFYAALLYYSSGQGLPIPCDAPILDGSWLG